MGFTILIVSKIRSIIPQRVPLIKQCGHQKKLAFKPSPLGGRWKSRVFSGSSCFFPIFTGRLISRRRRQLPSKQALIQSARVDQRLLEGKPMTSEEPRNLSVSLRLTALLEKGAPLERAKKGNKKARRAFALPAGGLGNGDDAWLREPAPAQRKLPEPGTGMRALLSQGLPPSEP